MGTLFDIAAVNDFEAKESARCKWVLVVTELFNIPVSNFYSKKSAYCSRVLIVTELIVSGAKSVMAHTHCTGTGTGNNRK